MVISVYFMSNFKQQTRIASYEDIICINQTTKPITL